MTKLSLAATVLALLGAAVCLGGTRQAPVARGYAVRYMVSDVDRSFAFYTKDLGFKAHPRQGPAFALVSLQGMRLWLSGPKSSGARPLPGGQKQKPGGWNRFVIEVDDLPAVIKRLKGAGHRFRNEMEVGPGGKQIQIEDPDGNPIELFEPASTPSKG